MAADDIIAPIQSGQGAAGRGVPAPIDYRQIERPIEGITPYHLQHSGGEQHAEALARVFKEFEGGAQAIEGAINKKAGAQAGAAAGAAGNPELKTGLAAITASGEAYNAAAHTAYIARTKDNLDAHLTEIEQDTAGDPISFQQRAQAAADAALKAAPDVYKPELQIDLTHRINAGVARTREQAIVTARNDAWASYTDGRDSRIQSTVKTASALTGDAQTAVIQNALMNDRSLLDGLVKARAISPERAAVLHDKFNGDMTSAVHDGYVSATVDRFMENSRAGDVEAADRAWKAYVSDPQHSEDDKNAVTTKYLAETTKYHEMQSRVYANDIAGVGQRLVQGVYGNSIEPEIRHLYKIGALSPEGLHSLLDQSMRNQVQGLEDDSTNQAFDAALNGTGPKFDPASASAKKAADTYVKTHMLSSNIAPLSDMWTATMSNFAQRTNIIPPLALAQIRIGLISDDPNVAARAAASAERIRSQNKDLDPYDKDPKAAATASMIDANLKSGMSAVRAVTLARQTLDRDEGQRKVIDAQYKKLVEQSPGANTKALQSALDSATPGMFNRAPNVSANPGLVAENDRLVGMFYGLTQDIDKSRQLAAQQIQTVWGVQHVNGAPELVKHPIPDKLAPIVRADLAERAKGSGFAGDPAELRLVPNSFTDSSDGRIWAVHHVDPKTGLEDVLLDDKNRPLAYSLPSTQQAFDGAVQALEDKKIAAAKAEREAKIKNRADQMLFEQQLADQYLTGGGRRAAQ